MLSNYKIKHREDDHSAWRIPFQFSTVTWLLLLLYHIIVFVCRERISCIPQYPTDVRVQSWTFTHLQSPDIDADDTRWKSRVLRFMSPPEERPGSRRGFYFSLFYMVTHIFALMNFVNYAAVLVPNGHDHWPSKGGGSSGFFMISDDCDCDKNPFKGVLPEGWYPIFCLFNLYAFPVIITLIEATVLNSIRPSEVRVGACLHLPADMTDTCLTARPKPPSWYSAVCCIVLGLCCTRGEGNRSQPFLLDGRGRSWQQDEGGRVLRRVHSFGSRK